MSGEFDETARNLLYFKFRHFWEEFALTQLSSKA